MTGFERYLEELRQKIKTLPNIVLQEKDLPYGRQLLLLQGTEKVMLSVYNGKKGIKVVWGGSDGALKHSAQTFIAGGKPGKVCKELSPGNHGISLLENCAGFKGIWAGSDESGKGDFFGPLVVAAVLVDTSIASKLAANGIKDCKALSDKEVLRQAPLIKEAAPLHVVLALKPEMYNYRYAQMKKEKKNLNHLLAQGHMAVLRKVLQQRQDCNYALVDRFSANDGIADCLEEEFPGLNVIEQPRAEADIAVAAASVLARARFLEIMDELSLLAGMTLPKGGGELATACARKLKDAFGEEILNKLVKMHFSNYNKLN